MAKYPYEYASLASWLQPRWVVEAPAQDQSLRLTKGNCTSRNPDMKWLTVHFVSQGWRCKLTSQSCSCRNLKTSENLRSFEYMLAHWPVCDLLSKHHRAMVLPAWSVDTCPKIQRKTPKLIMPFHSLWPRDYCTSKIIEMPRENWPNKVGILLHDNVRNIATIPMPLETNLSGCKTSLMSLWISAMLDNLAMDPPAISCHEDQFPHVVKQINTTRKWHFFTCRTSP